MVYQFTTTGLKPYKTFTFPAFFAVFATKPASYFSATVSKKDIDNDTTHAQQ